MMPCSNDCAATEPHEEDTLTEPITDARFEQPEETFDTVMLCTVSAGGTIHARPMVVAAVDDAHCWWFVTPADSVTRHEIASHADVAVTLQGRRSYATVTGRAAVVGGIDAMSRSPLSQSLPHDVADDTVFVRFQPTLGTYWAAGASEPNPLPLQEAEALLGPRAIDAGRAAAHVEAVMS